MKQHRLVFTLLLFLSISVASVGQTQGSLANPDSLKKHLTYLASDELRGRLCGSPEEMVTASFIAQYFKTIGLMGVNLDRRNPYMQFFSPVTIKMNNRSKLKIKETGQSLFVNSDILPMSYNGFGNGSYRCYMGDVDSLAGRKGYARVVIATDILDGMSKIDALQASKPGSNAFVLSLPPKKLVEFSQSRSFLSSYLIPSLNTFNDTLVTSMFGATVALKDNLFYSKVLPMLVKHPDLKVFVTDDFLLKRLFDKSALANGSASTAVGKAIEVTGKFDGDRLSRKDHPNVVGIIEGTTLKQEAVVLCAHYDHIGVGGSFAARSTSPTDSIYNGADDNGSGTVAILEVARLMAANGAQKRTIIVASFTGEEAGLLGSQYFALNPIPGYNIKAVVNLDMVGRTNEGHTDDDMYVYAMPLVDSLIFKNPVELASKKMDIVIPGIPDKERQMWTFGSDHYPFVKRSIPALVVTTGEHPDYHGPFDQVDRINFKRLERITNFTYYTLKELANPK